MGGGLINFPTRHIRWIKVEPDNGSDDGGDDSSSKSYIDIIASDLEKELRPIAYYIPATQEVVSFEDYDMTRYFEDSMSEVPSPYYLYDGSLTKDQIDYQDGTNFTRRLWPICLCVQSYNMTQAIGTLFYDVLNHGQILDEYGNIENLPGNVDGTEDTFQLYPLEINGKSYKILGPASNQ